jgi:SnoaL-like protein
MTVDEWLNGYAEAWREKDPAAAAALFTEQGVYRDQPFEHPHLGQSGVADYWRNVTATQEAVELRYGTAITSEDQRRAAVEFWVTMLNSDAEVTLAGILFLRFDANGACEELREAWHFQLGHLEPPAGWGS